MMQEVSKFDLFALQNEFNPWVSDAIELSERLWLVRYDNHIAAYGGLVRRSLISQTGYVWLQTESIPPRLRFRFVRESVRLIPELLSYFPLVVGHCAVYAEDSQRWLRWLGAEFGDPIGGAIPFRFEAKA